MVLPDRIELSTSPLPLRAPACAPRGQPRSKTGNAARAPIRKVLSTKGAGRSVRLLKSSWNAADTVLDPSRQGRLAPSVLGISKGKPCER
jgi:hypothetical protein